MDYLQNAYKRKEFIKTEQTVAGLKKKLISFFNQGNLKLEYLEIVDETTLLPIKNTNEKGTCCIAAFCGPVRLIDNMSLKA
ncbi:MAG: pantoate--beta-alanine ligase [Crocinitomicaceae bacterium]|nr:pantoate--beta-alanine ligase [Crocinitomicaceae bacterium]